MLCALLVVLDANLPRPQSRAEIPGVMLMAALPHRRLERESKRQTVGMEAVYADTARADIAGFTLIEMAVVLMIIGLIVGGVLVGQDLIGAAQGRAQISQVEKFQIAAATFQGKYGFLPGDIPAGPAAQFGFAPRGTGQGQGDGDGNLWGANSVLTNECEGELATFWVDLSAAHLIEGGFNTGSETNCAAAGGNISATTTPNLSAYFPQAKLGTNNYVFVLPGAGFVGWGNDPNGIDNSWSVDNKNYFYVASLTVSSNSPSVTAGSLTVASAYAIDKKVDDGMPFTGSIRAVFWQNYNNFNVLNTNPSGVPWDPNNPVTTQLYPSSTSCYDNNGNPNGNFTSTASITHYSVEVNDGAGVNCALSFRMQAGD